MFPVQTMKTRNQVLHPLFPNPVRYFLLICLLTATPELGFSQEDMSFTVYTGPRSLDRIRNTPIGSSPQDPAAQFSAALFKEAGLKFTLTVVPWARAVNALQTDPNILVYSMIRNAQREDLYEWIGLISRVQTDLYGLESRFGDSPVPLEQLRSYNIGLSRLSATDLYLSSKGFDNLMYSVDPARAPLMLLRGRIDLIPMTQAEAERVMDDRQLQDDALVPVARLPELSTGTYYVVSKQTSPDLVDRLKQAYQRLLENGIHEQILGD